MQAVAPGPGQYASDYNDAIKKPKRVPKEQQFFGSTQRRNYEACFTTAATRLLLSCH